MVSFEVIQHVSSEALHAQDWRTHNTATRAPKRAFAHLGKQVAECLLCFHDSFHMISLSIVRKLFQTLKPSYLKDSIQNLLFPLPKLNLSLQNLIQPQSQPNLPFLSILSKCLVSKSPMFMEECWENKIQAQPFPLTHFNPKFPQNKSLCLLPMRCGRALLNRFSKHFVTIFIMILHKLISRKSLEVSAVPNLTCHFETLDIVVC